MKLRKFNAGLSLLVTCLLLAHAISLALWMLSRGAIPQPPSPLPRMLTMATVIHALVSIGLLIAGNKDRTSIKGRHYPKQNAPMIIQRVSGVLLLIFSWLHIAGTVGIMTPPPLVHAIVPPVFFTIAMAHVVISTPKAFVTLGIGNAKFIKALSIAIRVLCLVVLIADIAGFYLHVC